MPAGTRPGDVTCESRCALKIRYASAEIVFSVNQLTRRPDTTGPVKGAQPSQRQRQHTRPEWKCRATTTARAVRRKRTSSVVLGPRFGLNVYLHRCAGRPVSRPMCCIHRERRDRPAVRRGGRDIVVHTGRFPSASRFRRHRSSSMTASRQ